MAVPYSRLQGIYTVIRHELCYYMYYFYLPEFTERIYCLLTEIEFALGKGQLEEIALFGAGNVFQLDLQLGINYRPAVRGAADIISGSWRYVWEQ